MSHAAAVSRACERLRGYTLTHYLNALVIVKPETVIRWHREGFRRYWRWKSRARRPGRPAIPPDTFAVLFVFIVPRHERRRIVHLEITAHPTAPWVAQQFREAFSWDSAPRRVRTSIFLQLALPICYLAKKEGLAV